MKCPRCQQDNPPHGIHRAPREKRSLDRSGVRARHSFARPTTRTSSVSMATSFAGWLLRRLARRKFCLECGAPVEGSAPNSRSHGDLIREVERLNRALTESAEQQTATSEILRVISSSPTDIRPVLKAVVESGAARARDDEESGRPHVPLHTGTPGATGKPAHRHHGAEHQARADHHECVPPRR